MHLIVLHDQAGSSNPLGVSGNYDRLPFAPYFLRAFMGKLLICENNRQTPGTP